MLNPSLSRTRVTLFKFMARVKQQTQPKKNKMQRRPVHRSSRRRSHHAKLATNSMKKNRITGGCYCGEVRFSASPEVRVSANCHCANCRRAAGAQAVAWIIVKRSQFQFVKGTPRRYQTETGAWRTFCGSCGTSLTYETDNRPDEIDITTGSLDHPEDFPPTKDVYPEERLPWVNLIHH
jgi:hypothetical protein